MRTFLLLLIIGVTFQSCIVYNSTKRLDTNICRVHKIKMKKALVGTRFGLGCHTGNTPEFPNAKTKQCMGCVVPIWPFKRLAIKYHCKECDKLKKESLIKENETK